MYHVAKNTSDMGAMPLRYMGIVGLNWVRNVRIGV